MTKFYIFEIWYKVVLTIWLQPIKLIYSNQEKRENKHYEQGRRSCGLAVVGHSFNSDGPRSNPGEINNFSPGKLLFLSTKGDKIEAGVGPF